MQKRYEKEGWSFHDYHLLEFEVPKDGSEERITLSVDPGSQDDFWEITPAASNQVRNFSPCVHIHVHVLPLSLESFSLLFTMLTANILHHKLSHDPTFLVALT